MPNALARAKRYPFARPPYSFVFAQGRALEIVEAGADPLADSLLRLDGRVMPASEALAELGVADAAPFAGRIAVLGYGSNAAPRAARAQIPRCARRRRDPGAARAPRRS